MSISLDPVTFDNWADVFAWRNDPTARANSIDQSVVPLEAHLKWFKDILTKDTVQMFIARDPIQGTKLGVARIDFKTPTTAEVSLIVAPGERGEGHGRQIIAKLVGLATRQAQTVRADVREENLPSLRAFAASSFTVRKIRKTDTGNIAELSYTPPLTS